MAQMQVEQQPKIPVAGGSTQVTTTSLYVADLDKSVTDSQLYDLFNQVGQVISVKVVKDNANESLGHGYVNYSNPDDGTPRTLSLIILCFYTDIRHMCVLSTFCGVCCVMFGFFYVSLFYLVFMICNSCSLIYCNLVDNLFCWLLGWLVSCDACCMWWM